MLCKKRTGEGRDGRRAEDSREEKRGEERDGE
jgi:hypothetical protein